MLIVYHRHLLSAKICSKGARGWWKSHGLNWSDFLANGIPAQELEKIDDVRVNQVIEVAKKDG